MVMHHFAHTLDAKAEVWVSAIEHPCVMESSKHDLWLHLMACQWQRIGQEEAFPGRCAEAGDDVGSAIVTARLARDLMRLALLLNRRYPPYSKWLGTAFARLPGTAGLAASLAAAVSGQ